MGKILKGILIVMVLFTFASLLSEPPAKNNAPTENEHVSLQQVSDATNKATSSGESNVSYAAPPESDKSDTVNEQKKAEDPETRSINDPDVVNESENTATDESAPVSDNVPFSTTIQKELDKEVLTDIEVVYNEYYKTLVVELHEDNPLSANFLRKTFALDSLSIIEIAAKYPDYIEEVTITGWTPMMSSDGNSETTKVYRSQAIMSEVSNVDWKNLKDYSPDKITAVESNMGSVWWHPGVLE